MASSNASLVVVACRILLATSIHTATLPRKALTTTSRHWLLPSAAATLQPLNLLSLGHTVEGHCPHAPTCLVSQYCYHALISIFQLNKVANRQIVHYVRLLPCTPRAASVRKNYRAKDERTGGGQIPPPESAARYPKPATPCSSHCKQFQQGRNTLDLALGFAIEATYPPPITFAVHRN